MDQLASTPKVLGNILKRQRKLKRLSQTEAGAPFGLEQSTISNLEKGAAGVRLDTLFRMLAALDLELVIREKHQNKLKRKEEW